MEFLIPFGLEKIENEIKTRVNVSQPIINFDTNSQYDSIES